MKRLIMYFIFCFAVSVPLNAQDTSKAEVRKGQKGELKSGQSNAGQGTSQNGHGRRFVDKNGDGYNDNAPDHDGDGIPNGLDPDYRGTKNRWGKKKFTDADGDGANGNSRGHGNRGRHSRHGRNEQKSGDSVNTGVRSNPDGKTSSRQSGLSGTGIKDSSKIKNKDNDS